MAIKDKDDLRWFHSGLATFQSLYIIEFLISKSAFVVIASFQEFSFMPFFNICR